MQVDILQALSRHGPLKLTHIMYKANANCSVLKQNLQLLAHCHLVENATLDKSMVYSITDKGKTALKNFRAIDNALQITEESQKTPELIY